MITFPIKFPTIWKFNILMVQLDCLISQATEVFVFEKRQTADSFVVNKLSVSPETE